MFNFSSFICRGFIENEQPHSSQYRRDRYQVFIRAQCTKHEHVQNADQDDTMGVYSVARCWGKTTSARARDRCVHLPNFLSTTNDADARWRRRGKSRKPDHRSENIDTIRNECVHFMKSCRHTRNSRCLGCRGWIFQKHKDPNRKWHRQYTQS